MASRMFLWKRQPGIVHLPRANRAMTHHPGTYEEMVRRPVTSLLAICSSGASSNLYFSKVRLLHGQKAEANVSSCEVDYGVFSLAYLVTTRQHRNSNGHASSSRP
jgi:hypothetical protein